jgi:hypothetical protein
VEPTYTRGQARRIVSCVGLFWGSWAPFFAGIAAGAPAVVVPFGLVAIGAGQVLFVTMADGYREYSGVSGATLIFGLSFAKERRRARNAVTFAPLRPRWWKNVTSASGWPGRWVAPILSGLLAADLAVYAVTASTIK